MRSMTFTRETNLTQNCTKLLKQKQNNKQKKKQPGKRIFSRKGWKQTNKNIAALTLDCEKQTKSIPANAWKTKTTSKRGTSFSWWLNAYPASLWGISDHRRSTKNKTSISLVQNECIVNKMPNRFFTLTVNYARHSKESLLASSFSSQLF